MPVYEPLFLKHNACVLLPTYNNAGTLADVLTKVLQYTTQVLVVNDGSTDDTEQILKRFPQVQPLSYSRNKGKGMALRAGFKEAARLGYDYVITMDSDGQHYAEDLEVFLKQLDETPGALMIGARNMNQENVPGKSSFGNRFSNFWYWVNTGISLPDTQSGYRLYPLKKLAKKKYITRKYEFEIEIIVRAAWSGIPVIQVPVSVYYPKPEDRVSHFRPFKDFTRISMLNTVLVLIALLWIKPRDFVMLLTSKDGWLRIWKAAFVNPQESNHAKAVSIAFGIFMGIVPIWGFQLAIGIPLAILMRMNKALFILAANISIFPFTPFIWVASLATGKLVLGYNEWSLNYNTLTLERFKQEGVAFFLGGTVLALAAGLIAYLITFTSLSLTRKPVAKR
jgi:glycosyltransferase involved in cell wall biosynthesis